MPWEAEPHILTVLSNLIFAFSVAGADGAPQAVAPALLALGDDFGAPQFTPLPAEHPLTKRIPRSRWQMIMTVKCLLKTDIL